jgi:hypothetical protein
VPQPVPMDAAPDAAFIQWDAAPSASDAGEDLTVSVGLNPASINDPALADLDVIALGAGAVSVTYRVGQGTELSQDLERARWFSENGASVLFALQLVRGLDAGSEADLGELRQLAERQIDRIYAADWAPTYLVLGYALDVQWQSLGGADRSAFSALVLELLAYAREHSDKPVDLRVGFHTTKNAWLEPSEALRDWREQADVTAVSWYGLDVDGRALGASASLRELEQVISEAGGAAKPVLFQEIAYPSGTAVGSSQRQQSGFYKELWKRIADHAPHIGFVAVSALDDPPEADCEAFARDLGLPVAAATAWSSTGLRDGSGARRLGYDAVLAGIATFAAR